MTIRMDQGVASGPARVPRPGVVERLTQILDAFADGPQHMLLEDITRATGLPRSTAFRLLTQLVDLHWLERGSRGYRLGVRVQRISGRVGDYSELRAAAYDVLNELQSRTGGVAHLTVLEGTSVHFLDRIGGVARNGIPSRVAVRVPAQDTVSGRALLACLMPEQVELLMSLGEHPLPTDRLSALHAQLNRVRQQRGVSHVPGEKCPLTISAVATPVRGPDGAIAAISLACRGVVELGRMAPLVRSAARRTSELLFPTSAERRLRTVHRSSNDFY
ncbi:IclR family transcriptional regulator [Rhodococcus sp. As11]|uniref:IclR family transcriptional regulator n=1 Tax=Rhodococcus sp. As11 TaxID=3029189 RepID=UPI003B7EAD10